MFPKKRDARGGVVLPAETLQVRQKLTVGGKIVPTASKIDLPVEMIQKKSLSLYGNDMANCDRHYKTLIQHEI